MTPQLQYRIIIASNAETNISTKEDTQEAGTWLLKAHEHSRRPSRAQEEEAKGSHASNGVGMRREERLAKRKDFETVYKKGRSWANNLLVLRALPNEVGASRYGFAVGKRLGGAVIRNRVKRRLREGARLTPVKDGWDIVLIARQHAVDTDYHTLKRAMEELLARAQLLGNGREEA